MSDLFWLTDEQIERLRPFFPKSHGRPRVDDRRVLSGIVFVNRNGLRWRDAPSSYVYLDFFTVQLLARRLPKDRKLSSV